MEPLTLLGTTSIIIEIYVVQRDGNIMSTKGKDETSDGGGLDGHMILSNSGQISSILHPEVLWGGAGMKLIV